jgi:hypothetical protein
MIKLKSILLVLFLLNQMPIMAQQDRLYNPFKIETAIGLVKTNLAENKFAIDFSLEPKYAISDAFWLGLRLETAILIQPIPSDDDFKAFGVFSVLPTLDFSFLPGRTIRPFLGIGAGIYTLKNLYDGEEASETQAINKLGFCPRLGFEFQRFRMGLEFNVIGGRDNYTTVKMGWSMGGGLKN